MAISRPSRMIVVPVAGVVLMVVGVAGLAVSTPRSASFGWFAYAPLSGTVFSPDGALVVGWGAIAGAGAVALGLAVFAFWMGFIVATARARRNP